MHQLENHGPRHSVRPEAAEPEAAAVAVVDRAAAAGWSGGGGGGCRTTAAAVRQRAEGLGGGNLGKKDVFLGGKGTFRCFVFFILK